MRYNLDVTFIRRLVWDQWNIMHIARHNVTPDEVEEVCHNDPLVQEGKKGRKLVIGLTISERMITVILDLEDKDHYYPVTARSTSKKERKLYFKEREAEENDKTKK